MRRHGAWGAEVTVPSLTLRASRLQSQYPAESLIRVYVSRVCPIEAALLPSGEIPFHQYALSAARLLEALGVAMQAGPLADPEARAEHEPKRLLSHREFFAECARQALASRTLRATFVGPTFLEPNWLVERSVQGDKFSDFTYALRHKLFDDPESFDVCEMVLRNNAPRYTRNLMEYVEDQKEWEKAIDEMKQALTILFGSHGEKGPRVRCIDPGYSHLPHLFDAAVVIGTRNSPEERVNGGWKIENASMINMEFERWAKLF